MRSNHTCLKGVVNCFVSFISWDEDTMPIEHVKYQIHGANGVLHTLQLLCVAFLGQGSQKTCATAATPRLAI